MRLLGAARPGGDDNRRGDFGGVAIDGTKAFFGVLLDVEDQQAVWGDVWVFCRRLVEAVGLQLLTK